jgi:sugar/nucleoside kinase (ribokinase family)
MALDQLAVEGYGVLTPRVREELAKIAAAHPRLIVYADSRAFISRFRGAVIKCNDHEAMKIVHPEKEIPPEEEVDPDEAGACLLELSKKSGREVFISCGSRGILVKDKGPRLVPAVPVSGPIDIVGAGDACSAGIITALCCGAEPAEAAALGNLAASITIQVIGATGTASREQLRKRYAEAAEELYGEEGPGGKGGEPR